MRLVLATLILTSIVAASLAPAAAGCSYSSSDQPVGPNAWIWRSGNGCDHGYPGGGSAYQNNETRIVEGYTGASVMYGHYSSNGSYTAPNGTQSGYNYDTIALWVENSHGSAVPRAFVFVSQSGGTTNGTQTGGSANFNVGFVSPVGNYYVAGPVPSGNGTYLPNVLRALPRTIP